MAKANKKYQTAACTPYSVNNEVKESAKKARENIFKNRREHNHYPQGKTGYVPKGK